MSFSDYLKERKVSLLFSIMVMFVVTVIYFSFVTYSLDSSIYENIKLKTNYAEGNIKVFALAENNLLTNVPSVEGNNLPEVGSLIIGFSEAQMMKEEKLFAKPGDKLSGFFGIDTSVGGVLRRTNSFMDDFHLLDKHDFDALQAEEGRTFIRFKEVNEPKIFYSLGYDEEPAFNLKLSEGSMDYYNNKTIVLNDYYYPVIIGFSEAQMMKDEGLFSQPGDTIQGFFGKNVVIAGVLEKTGTILDMVHIIPLSEQEFDS